MTIDPFLYSSRAVDVRFGRGRAADNVRDCIEAHDARRVLVVATRSQTATADRLTAELGDRVVARFADVREHVPASTADAARRTAAEAEADLVLSIGGGSTTGTAKAIVMTAGIPIIAVPTTLAGSEMTDTWGITTDGRKRTGKDPRVLPKAVVYDPSLLDGLPERLKVTSSFNAMAHCVEAFWGPRANPLTSVVAAEGVRRLADGLRAHGRGEARSVDELQYGSFLAGLVFADAGSGLHHKICHALGGAFDLSHAGTHTVILPRVVRFNAPTVPETAAALATALRVDDAAAGLEDLIAETSAPRTLRELGMREDELPAAVDVVAEKLPIDNPREVTREALQQLLGAAYDGKDLR